MSKIIRSFKQRKWWQFWKPEWVLKANFISGSEMVAIELTGPSLEGLMELQEEFINEFTKEN